MTVSLNWLWLSAWYASVEKSNHQPVMVGLVAVHKCLNWYFAAEFVRIMDNKKYFGNWI